MNDFNNFYVLTNFRFILFSMNKKNFTKPAY